MAYEINKDMLCTYKPHVLQTVLTLSGGAVAATKISPTVASGSIGIHIMGIHVKSGASSTDTSIDLTLHHRNTSGGTFTEIAKQTAKDATVKPVNMINTTDFPGLPLLNSGSPFLPLGEGEELGLQVAAGTGTDTIDVLVVYYDLFIQTA